MSDFLHLQGSLAIPRRELQWRFSRSSGPGGQSVNTTDSRVELRWNLHASTALPEHLRQRALHNLQHRLTNGMITIVAAEERSQLRNRQAAEQRLVSLLVGAIAPPAAPRRPTKPSKGARQRRLDAKRRTGDIKRNRRPPQE